MNDKPKKPTRKELGLCCSCGNATIPGTSRCEKHTRLASEKSAAKYAANKTIVACKGCDEAPPVAGKEYCQACLDARAATRNATQAAKRATGLTWYAERRALGLCIRCDNPATDNARCEAHQALRRAEHKKKRATGCCIDCDRPAEPGASRCSVHIAQRKAEYAKRKQEGTCLSCGAPRVADSAYCQKHWASNKVKDRKKYRKLIAQVQHAYGGDHPKCACCPERNREFLQIDHVNNDGSDHRRALSGKNWGTTIYTWLRKNNFPPGFQLLCSNCNHAKGRYGICPHEQLRRDFAAVGLVAADDDLRDMAAARVRLAAVVAARATKKRQLVD